MKLRYTGNQSVIIRDLNEVKVNPGDIVPGDVEDDLAKKLLKSGNFEAYKKPEPKIVVMDSTIIRKKPDKETVRSKKTTK